MAMLLEDVPLATRRDIIYKHDGCPARSPDRFEALRLLHLEPHDKTQVNSQEELRDRILTAGQHIKDTITSRVKRPNVRKNLSACIRNGGAHFEQDV